MYWDKRYSEKAEPIDWVVKPQQLMSLLDKVTQGCHMLDIAHVGCGNSLLSEEMYDLGFKSIVNIDYSGVVISLMKERNAVVRPDMSWVVMDAFNTDFPDGRFDVVIDKALVDSFLCECKEATRLQTVAKYMEEMSRILKSSGVFLCISFGPPDDRLEFFSLLGSGFKIEVIEIPSNNTQISHCHWAYVCTNAKQSPYTSVDLAA